MNDQIHNISNPEIIVIDPQIDKQYRNEDIINILMQGIKARSIYPTNEIGCIMDNKFILQNPEINFMITMVFDRLLTPLEYLNFKMNKNTVIQKSIDHVDKIDQIDHIGGSNAKIIDTNNYDLYFKLKSYLGPIHTENFIFKEHDIVMKMNGGHKQNNKKKDRKQEKTNLCKIYNVKCDQIKHNQINYYHKNPKKRSQFFNIKPMFDNIDEYSYLTPLEKLAKYHSNDNYYEKLLKRNKQFLEDAYKRKIRLNLLDEIMPEDRDTIMLEYIKCRPNTMILTLWKPAFPGIDEFIKLLEKDGNVYYVKVFNLTESGIRNLMFSYYDEFSIDAAIEFIGKKMKYIDTTDNGNQVCFIAFDNVKNKLISGQGAPYKRFLRSAILDIMKNKDKLFDSEKHTGNDMLHINDHFYQTIEYSQTMLNKNSLEFMDMQNLNQFNTYNFGNSNLKFQTLRNVLYKEFSLLEIDRFIIMGGALLYAYGIRAFNDIDALFIDNLPNNSSHLIDIIDRDFSDSRTRFFFMDAAIQGSKFWKDSWVEKNKIIFDFLGIKDEKDLTLNPKNHMYFQGVKFVLLDLEILKKIIRYRIQDHVDFLMMNLLYPHIIEPYVLLNDSKLNDSKLNYSDKNIDAFLIPKKYEKITGLYNDKSPELNTTILKKRHDVGQKILKRRYDVEQINKAKNDPRFNAFFAIY